MNTMDIILQLWGGSCYLMSKIFLGQAEGSADGRRFRLRGWLMYALGVPAWVVVLAAKQNWMAMSIEAGGIPAIVLGLFTAYRGATEAPRRVQKSVAVFSYGLLVVGAAYSIYDYHGLKTLSQFFELGVMAGFLIGTNLLARKNPQGWLWFMLMNLSMGLLMVENNKWLLAAQQLASLGFVVRGFVRSRRLIKTIQTASLVVSTIP